MNRKKEKRGRRSPCGPLFCEGLSDEGQPSTGDLQRKVVGRDFGGLTFQVDTVFVQAVALVAVISGAVQIAHENRAQGHARMKDWWDLVKRCDQPG